MEYKKVVAVNENDEVVGSVETIQEALDKGLFRRIARVFIFNTEGKILIQKRSSTVRHPLLLDQSVGGHVNEGESYLEAALRETDEELGLTGVTLIEIAISHKETTVFSAVYKATIPIETEVNFDVAEVDSVHWMTAKEIDESISCFPEQWTGGVIEVWQQYRDTLLA